MPSKTIKLIKAAERGDFRRVALLLRDGAEVNGLDKDGTTALRSAVSSLGISKAQVIKGRLVTSPIVPLEAVSKTVRLLLKAGADPNLGHEEYGTPLFSAAAGGNLPVVRMLIEAGALPDPAHETGLTPLARAVYNGRAKVVEYLLRHGADPRLKDVEGRSVLEAARRVRRRGPENQPIYEMVRAASAKLPKNDGRKPASQSPGPALGIKDFTRMDVHPEWSLFAVKAPVEAVARALADFRKPLRFERRVPLKPAKKFEQLARLTAVLGIKDNSWAVVLRSVGVVSAEELEGVPKEAKTISAKLKTRAATLLYEDTSNAMGYALYERGRLLEEAEWECGGEMRSFTSTLRQRPEGRRFTEDFAEQLFRSEGIYIPACYPRREGGRVWLSVQKPSAGLIGRADLLELGKIATPPFAQKHGLMIRVVDDLRERLLTNEAGLPSDEVWRKSWEDFSFCLPGCESSLAAQARICRAIGGIAQSAKGTSAIFTHGNVIPLFLNALTRTVGRADAEALTNPDVLKITWRSGAFAWDRAFRLPGLARIATDHRQTPIEQDTPAPQPAGWSEREAAVTPGLQS